MVLRKTDEQERLVPAPLSKAQPPYPTTPSEEHPPAIPTSSEEPYAPSHSKSPAFNFKTPEDTQLPDTADLDSDFSDDSWDRSDDDADLEDVKPHEVPDALKPAGGKAPTAFLPSKEALPDSLRAGPPAGVPIKKSLESIAPIPTGASSASYGATSTVSEHSNSSLPLQTNNPYLKMQTTGQSSWGGESSQAIWGESHADTQKHDVPAELPANYTPATPTHDMYNLKIESNVPPTRSSKSPDQPPLIAVNSATPQSVHPDSSLDMNTNPWGQGMTPSHPTASPDYPAPAPSKNHDGQDVLQHDAERREQKDRTTSEPAHRVQQQHAPEQAFKPTEQVDLSPQFTPQPTSPHAEEQAPALPPRRSQEQYPPTMSPPSIDTGVRSVDFPGPESPNTTMNRHRKEHYQIKHIRWYDHNKQGIRNSPILTQNANGPCPLLALVNALVLSTTPGIDTALVETLRTRETVSLGLLLDAVFDELMSGRRGDAAQALPDVSELYKFLLALHTGLNVNPMFVPDTHSPIGNAALTNRAGSFEDTQDMKLYRTFNIPLMHGWLPQSGSEAYKAFERVARSYETSQYVQFQEEELDAKLQSGASLTADEQQMFTDIHAIKEFLMRWPTQLTDHGLKVIRDNLQYGQVAILFRNDHFSTLCKDPRTDRLVTLVTDQGYSTHDEIVWESLVDVNGQGSELFSGDFRSVDNSKAPPRTQEQQQSSDIDDGQGWTTVQGHRGNQQQSLPVPHATSQDTGPSSADGLSRAEQEDHDLALALQLQEEEEERQRRETAQRERDNQASMNTIAASSQSRPGGGRHVSREEQAPVVPPRRNNITTHRPTNEAAPPPTYEEASTAPRYNPPAGHPANPQAPLPSQGSSYPSNNSGRRYSGRPMQPPTVGMPGRPGRRQSAGAGIVGQQNPNEEREKCVIM